MFAENNARVWELLRGWLACYFPAMEAPRRAAAGARH
jgi:hypothetical protein